MGWIRRIGNVINYNNDCSSKISGTFRWDKNVFMSSYFRKYYADHFTQMCLDVMQGQSVDSDNTLVTLVHSASPLIDQLTPSKCLVTFSTECSIFANELRIIAFVFLLSRLVILFVYCSISDRCWITNVTQNLYSTGIRGCFICCLYQVFTRFIYIVDLGRK